MIDRNGERSPTSRRVAVTFHDEAVANKEIAVLSIPTVNISPFVNISLVAVGDEDIAEPETEGEKVDLEDDKGGDTRREIEGTEEIIDDDGAVCFEGECGESRSVRAPPDVPVPSRDMVRRHRAAGHCPYRAWCAHCVPGAANLPGRKPRSKSTITDVPEM